MTAFKKKVEAFNSLIQQAKFTEAVDTFYDENIVSTDNMDEPMRGIKIFREAAEKFITDTKFEKLNLEESIVEENLSVAKWHYIFTHHKFGRLDYKQVSVQRWNNGKIIQENHFYNLG